MLQPLKPHSNVSNIHVVLSFAFHCLSCLILEGIEIAVSFQNVPSLGDTGVVGLLHWPT